ncbi:MAG: hypothetical protein AAF614_01665 [Chloroflexota bacterium]
MAENKPITYGSIIHLKNGLGGYLDTRGLVQDKPTVLTNWYDPRVRSFVFTHPSPNRSIGSGSWEILSPTEKPVGNPVKIGDRVHLRNIYSDNGYLDSFEWVDRIGEFAHYAPQMQIGVFTSRKRRRDGGESGTWKIRSAAGKPDGALLLVGDDITLINNSGTYLEDSLEYLRAYGNVTDHAVFADYDRQASLVFIGQPPAVNDGSHQWTVSLNNAAESIYYIWGQVNGRWTDFGIIQYAGVLKQTIVALQAMADDSGQILQGYVAYEEDGPINFTAVWDAQEKGYHVQHTLNQRPTDSHPDGLWHFGGLGKAIGAIDLLSNDDGRTFRGSITYFGEWEAIDLKGIRATPAFLDTKPQNFTYQFFDHRAWEERIFNISNTLETAVATFNTALLDLGSAHLTQKSIDAQSVEYPYLQNNFNIEAVVASQTHIGIDFAYQLKQLLNIHTLWLTMKEFWGEVAFVSQFAIKKLHDARILPPVHRIRDCIRQTTVDIELVQRAVQQRRWLADSDDDNASAKSLVVTDKLTSMALAPFQRLIPGAATITPITYFNQRIHIRQLPYNDEFILVGLTYDLASSIGFATRPDGQMSSSSLELMAIPHEVGHFLYRFARFDDNSSYEEFGESSSKTSFEAIGQQFVDNPFYRWCEEIFADLYGCVVGGPFAVLGFQALLATGDRERVLMDDEEHPTPILRAFILSEMLQILSEKKPERYRFSEIAMSLDANWTSILERWGFVVEDVVNGRPGRIMLTSESGEHVEGFVNVRKTVEIARAIIETFVDILLVKADFEPWETSPGSATLSANIPWSAKYDSLAEYIRDIYGLVGPQIASQEAAEHKLSTHYQLKESIQTEIQAVLAENIEQIGPKLLRTILDGWDDDGAHGFGGH